MNERLLFDAKGKDPMYKVWHASGENMFLFSFTDGGSIVCSEKIYNLKKNVLYFVGAAKHHFTMPDKPSEYKRHKLFVSTDMLERIKNLFNSEHPFSRIFGEEVLIYSELSEEQADEVQRLFSELEECDVQSDKFEEIYVGVLLGLMSVVKDNLVDIAESSISGSLRKAVEYVNAHIYEPISIDEVCKEVHMSKSYLCRLFRRKMGVTVMDYILNTRIVLARNMLLKDKMTVSEISERCSFSSVSYFCRIFKDKTGMSPLQYRKNADINH